MEDKSFLQAVEDLQDRIDNNVQESIQHMLWHGTTVDDATLEIKDEKMREVVKDALMTGQIIASLTLLRELGLLGKTQYNELTAYLQRRLTF